MDITSDFKLSPGACGISLQLSPTFPPDRPDKRFSAALNVPRRRPCRNAPYPPFRTICVRPKGHSATEQDVSKNNKTAFYGGQVSDPMEGSRLKNEPDEATLRNQDGHGARQAAVKFSGTNSAQAPVGGSRLKGQATAVSAHAVSAHQDETAAARRNLQSLAEAPKPKGSDLRSPLRRSECLRLKLVAPAFFALSHNRFRNRRVHRASFRKFWTAAK